MSEKMREEFEAHQLRRYQYADVTQDTDGRYLNVPMESEWETWQAALRTHENGEAFPYQRTFDAIVAAIELPDGCNQVSISVEKFKAAYGPLRLAPPSAKAIETAAIVKCAEEVFRHVESDDDANAAHDAILALIPQDGRTQLEELLTLATDKAWGMYCSNAEWTHEHVRAIVTNLMNGNGK